MWRFFRPHAAFPRFTSNAAERHATKTNRLKDTRCEDSIAVTRGQWNFPKRLSNPQFSDDFVICWRSKGQASERESKSPTSRAKTARIAQTLTNRLATVQMSLLSREISCQVPMCRKVRRAVDAVQQ